MKRNIYTLFFGCLGLFLVHCTNPVDNALEENSSISSKNAVGAANTVVINNYTVQFDGRQYDAGDDQTTFSYTVTGNNVEPALSHFTIELPDCAPDLSGFSPTISTSINTNTATGIFGIEWHLKVEPDDSTGRTYTVTFPGDVPLGTVNSIVKSGNTFEVAKIPGPCAGFDIAGAVFVDTDENGSQTEADESGIDKVTVQLTDAGGNVETIVTDAEGKYLFKKPEGTYTISIELSTSANDFNEQLGTSFTTTTGYSQEVTVGPDASDISFGFRPIAEEIVLDIEIGDLTTNGESDKFWQKQLRSAAGNGKGKVEFDAAELLGFLNTIETLFLDTPFQFTDGNELQEALDILNTKTKTIVEELRRQLLVAELNEVSGKGLNDKELQDVVLSWCESLVKDAFSTKPTASLPILLKTTNGVDGALDVLNSINRSGGGGGVGGS